MSATDDAAKVAAQLKKLSRAPVAIDQALRISAMDGLARVKLNASGRPGPRRVTGDYTRTINVQESRSSRGASFSIGTNAAQARRLEYGFNSSDSLGRRYSQRPYPHWRPMFEWLQSRVTTRLMDALESLGR